MALALTNAMELLISCATPAILLPISGAKKKRPASRFFSNGRAYLPLEPVPDVVSLGVLLLPLLLPEVPPLLPLVLVLPPVPEVPEVPAPEVPAPDVPAPEVLPAPAAPLVPDEAASDFLAFLCFLVAFFFFGVVPDALVSPWADEDAAGEEEVPAPAAPEVSPEAPLDDLPVSLEEPLMPVPLAPEAPDDVPLAPDDDVPLAPEDEVPELPPLMPVSLLPLLPVAPVWLDGLDEVDDDLPVSVEVLCASAIEDTDAINTSDNDRSVDFNAMESSFN